MCNDEIQQLVNEECKSFMLNEGGTLILYFGTAISADPYQTRFHFWIDSAWRLESSERVLIGSLNESEIVMRTLQAIKGAVIKNIHCNDVTRDITIIFDSGKVLRTFAHSTQDELWELRRSDGYRYAAGPLNA